MFPASNPLVTGRAYYCCRSLHFYTSKVKSFYVRVLLNVGILVITLSICFFMLFIIGEITPFTLLRRNSFIIKRDLVTRDFDLKVEYRVSRLEIAALITVVKRLIPFLTRCVATRQILTDKIITVVKLWRKMTNNAGLPRAKSGARYVTGFNGIKSMWFKIQNILHRSHINRFKIK